MFEFVRVSVVKQWRIVFGFVSDCVVKERCLSVPGTLEMEGSKKPVISTVQKLS
ncbi:hypothetical protein [Bacillus sp. HMF5848]|uniref:hypothetical protein n=1 Tax=Bacillus sp. HMF5848 TaxID=2495421 RepID=UPI001639C6AE|nr:hypothetical protein [Bacillus sp. HMF5848]